MRRIYNVLLNGQILKESKKDSLKKIKTLPEHAHLTWSIEKKEKSNALKCLCCGGTEYEDFVGCTWKVCVTCRYANVKKNRVVMVNPTQPALSLACRQCNWIAWEMARSTRTGK